MRAATLIVTAIVAALSATRANGESSLEQVTIEGSRYASEVTVAGKTPAQPREIPSSVSVITAERIEDQNLITVADALSNVTGITVVPNDGTQSQYRSRGYVLTVMNDGVPAYNALSGSQQLDLIVYDRLEVLRGPSGVLQGSGDPGGTLNLVTKKPHDKLGFTGSVSAGRWNNYRATADLTGPLIADGSVRGRVAAAWQDRDTFVDRNANRRTVGYGTIDWDVASTTTLSVSAIAQRDRVSVPYSGLPAAESGAQLDVSRSTSDSPPWAHSRWDIDDFAVSLDHHFASRWQLRARVSRRNQDLLFHDAYTISSVRASDYTAPFARRKYEYDFERTAADLFLTGPVDLFGRSHTLLIGYNYDSLDTQFRGVEQSTAEVAVRAPFDHTELVPIIDAAYDRGGHTEMRQRGLYAQAHVSILDALTLHAGARLSHFETRSHSVAPGTPSPWRQGDGVNAEVTPFAGLVYDVNSFLTLYGSYASIFLPQSTLLDAAGNSLEPRVGGQFELGTKAAFLENRLNASLARFEIRDRNRALANPAAPGFFTAAGKVESKGWETELFGTVANVLDIQAGYARLDTLYVNAQPSRIGLVFDSFEPRHTWRLWGVRRFDPVAGSHWSLGLGLTGQSKLPSDATPTEPRVQGGFTIVSAMLAWRRDERLTLDFNATNLFDKTYYARIGGVNIYNTFGEPRSYSLTARYRL